MKRWERRYLQDDRLLRELAKHDRARANYAAYDQDGTAPASLTSRYLPVLRPLRSETSRMKIPLGR